MSTVTIASPRPPRPLLALPGKPDLRPVLEALGQFEVYRLAVGQCDALRLQRDRVDERDFQPVGDIGAFLRHPLRWRKPEKPPPPPPPRAAFAAPNSPSNKSLRSAESPNPPWKPSNPPPGPRPARAAGTGRIAAKAGPEGHLGVAVLVDLAAVILRALVLV
jgi:hypothetical protein